ncbi:MAG: DnaJ domain-containing protein [Clostridiales bacterium]|jgi:hypothetical protein|nr:DnaJ domain-containing protein [Clostridiales bacterium]
MTHAELIKTAYTTLELEFGATEAQVNSAYKELTKKYHPDLAANKNDAEEQERLNKLQAELNSARKFLLKYLEIESEKAKVTPKEAKKEEINILIQNIKANLQEANAIIDNSSTIPLQLDYNPNQIDIIFNYIVEFINNVQPKICQYISNAENSRKRLEALLPKSPALEVYFYKIEDSNKNLGRCEVVTLGHVFHCSKNFTLEQSLKIGKAAMQSKTLAEVDISRIKDSLINGIKDPHSQNELRALLDKAAPKYPSMGLNQQTINTANSDISWAFSDWSGAGIIPHLKTCLNILETAATTQELIAIYKLLPSNHDVISIIIEKNQYEISPDQAIEFLKIFADKADNRNIKTCQRYTKIATSLLVNASGDDYSKILKNLDLSLYKYYTISNAPQPQPQPTPDSSPSPPPPAQAISR